MTKINVEITSKFHQNLPVANELKKKMPQHRGHSNMHTVGNLLFYRSLVTVSFICAFQCSFLRTGVLL